MGHAKFSPSSAHRWMECAPSMTLELPYQRVGASKYADEGTVAHRLLEWTLRHTDKNCVDYPNLIEAVNTLDEAGKVLCTTWHDVDEDMRMHVQKVVDSVRRRVAQGWRLLIEQRVDFSNTIGIEDQYGTADIILISPDGCTVSVEDLKYGMGHKVYAEKNHQALAYGVGTLETFDGLLGDFECFELRIHQPRLDHEDSWSCSRDAVELFGAEMAHGAASCIEILEVAAKYPDKDPVEMIDKDDYKPDPKKTCLWCKAKASCPAYEKFVLDEMMGDMQDLTNEQKQITLIVEGPQMPNSERLGVVFGNLPAIEAWVAAVKNEVTRQVMAGMTVTGQDGEPLKVIEGRKGNRAWSDEGTAEGVLCGLLPPEKVYKPRELVSPSAIAKIFDKKKTQATWQTLLPYIKQAPGHPKIVESSVEGVPYTGEIAQDGEFVDLSDPGE